MKPFTFLLVSTFLVGMISGMYVYFVSRSTEPVFDFPQNETTGGFEVIVDAYGGCQMLGECPSYRITADGSYIYLVSHRNAADDQYEGYIESDAFDALENAVQNAPLERVAASEFSGTCPIAADGAAYRYEIRVGETSYSLDSCREDTEGVRLFEILEDYFAYFHERHYTE